MAFGSTLQFSSDAANSSPPCRSHFQKSVHLRDWWLTKPEPDDGRKTLGVAGLTCTSQQCVLSISMGFVLYLVLQYLLCYHSDTNWTLCYHHESSRVEGLRFCVSQFGTFG